MDLTVIIVNYNTRLFLEQCLHALDRALKGIEAEVIIIDNHSSDGSLDYIQAKFPTLKYLSNKENLGFAKANNQGRVFLVDDFISCAPLSCFSS